MILTREQVIKILGWDKDLEKKFENSVNAAMEKATCYHCRSPHYIEEE